MLPLSNPPPPCFRGSKFPLFLVVFGAERNFFPLLRDPSVGLPAPIVPALNKVCLTVLTSVLRNVFVKKGCV